MANYYDTKVSPEIRGFIERAGELEEAQASVALRRDFAKHSIEEAKGPSTPLRTIEFTIEPQSSAFNEELAENFTNGEHLQWMHSPKEFIKWLANSLEEKSLSYKEIYFALQDARPVTPFALISTDSLNQTLRLLTTCGLLHTEVQYDRTNDIQYPVEKYFFNINREAQIFLQDILCDSKAESLDANIDQEALSYLNRLLQRAQIFCSTDGLKKFLELFNVPASQSIGSGTVLNIMGDFTHTNRQLIEHILGCATQANILTYDERGLYRLTSAGKQLLEFQE